jgi:aryl-alcohol dehydrogenase-like predicted oxidoreductase
MQYRMLGRTGIKVSEIGFGAWGIGAHWGPRDDHLARAALRNALDCGINFIDTAQAYGEGHSERLIADVLKEKGDGVAVATKIPPKNHEWPARPDTPLHAAFPKDWIIRCTERSLKSLETDCLDLQQLHVWAARWINETDWIETLQDLKTQGKIRFIGVSINDHEPDTAIELVHEGWVDTLQVIYNIFDQSPAEQLFSLAREKNVGIIARSPLDEGGLTGKLTHDTVFPEGDWRRSYFEGDRLKQTIERADRLNFLIRDEIRSLSHAALKFCLSHEAVSTVIPGMRRPLHVEENCAVSDGKRLSPDELSLLAEHAWPKNFYD